MASGACGPVDGRRKEVYYTGSASQTTVFVGGIYDRRTAGTLTPHYPQILNALGL